MALGATAARPRHYTSPLLLAATGARVVVFAQLHAVPPWLVLLAFAAGVAFIILRWRR
jgi:hypothetical protein